MTDRRCPTCSSPALATLRCVPPFRLPGAGARGVGGRGGSDHLPRRQHPTHPQHANRPRCRQRDPHRPLPGRRAPHRPGGGHGAQLEQGPGQAPGRRVARHVGLDAGARRSIPAIARGNAQPRTDQRVLSRRWSSDAQRAPPHRRRPRCGGVVRRRGGGCRARSRERPVPVGADPARPGARLPGPARHSRTRPGRTQPCRARRDSRGCSRPGSQLERSWLPPVGSKPTSSGSRSRGGLQPGTSWCEARPTTEGGSCGCWETPAST